MAVRRLKAVFVEDVLSDVELCVAALSAAPFALQWEVVDNAATFRAAVAHDDIDLVIADYSLPGWNGLEALAILKELGRDTPFILVTGTVGEETAVECIKQGVADYVLKDRLARLPLAVERALAEKEQRTERQQAREALERSEREYRTLFERYRGLFENANDIVYSHGLDGKITAWNSAGERVLGYSQAEAMGMKIEQLVAPECRRRFAQVLEGIVAGKPAAAYQIEMVSRDGRQVALEVSSRLTRGDGVNEVQGIARDITERKRLEDELRQAQKMEAIGRLAGGVAHDFNNLLLVITGYGELLKDHWRDTRAQGRAIEEILKAATRAADLTRQLLAFSRKQLLQPRLLDLNEVVSNAGGMLKRLIREDIELVLAPDSQPCWVKADAGQIEQVLVNLVVNARDAIPARGRITVATESPRGASRPDSLAAVDMPRVPDRAAMAPDAREPGGDQEAVVLRITDNGCGMDAETVDRIFEPFFTTKKGTGTGLGLATVYGIVKQSGGNILVFSEPGQGSTFTIRLPAAQPEAVTPATPEADRQPHPRRGTVLLVEDEEKVRLLLSELLSGSGYQVLEARDGEEALEICRSFFGSIDLMLTDLVMPNLGGAELAELAASLRPNMKAIYMSGYTDDAVVHGGILASGFPFLQKPFTSRDVLEKIREVLDAAGGAVDAEAAARNPGAR